MLFNSLFNIFPLSEDTVVHESVINILTNKNKVLGRDVGDRLYPVVETLVKAT